MQSPTSREVEVPHVQSGAGKHIDIAGLEKVYESKAGPVTALKAVDLQIAEGSFVSLVGPSGCGKSTLLKLIAGLIEPTRGRILIGGGAVTGPSRSRGLMFQTPVLFDWRTVLENVMLPFEAGGGRHRDRGRARAEEVLELVGLTQFAQFYPRQLSGGMQQRVALSRLLVYDPPILLMDEPFGALDEFTRERLNIELLSLWQRTNKTIVFVTHSIAEAVLLSERVVAMGTQPGCVLDVVDVELPFPRTPETTTTTEFTQTVAAIRRYLVR